jgi:hypothetical protein
MARVQKAAVAVGSHHFLMEAAIVGWPIEIRDSNRYPPIHQVRIREVHRDGNLSQIDLCVIPGKKNVRFQGRKELYLMKTDLQLLFDK